MIESDSNLITNTVEVQCEEFLEEMYSLIQNNKLYVLYFKNKLIKKEYFKFIKMIIDTIKETGIKKIKNIVLLCFSKFFDTEGFIFYSNLDREIIKSTRFNKN